MRGQAGWGYFDNTIISTRQGDSLAAKGDAYWPSARPSQGHFPGGPNIGNVAGTAKPQAGHVTFTKGSGVYRGALQARLVETLLLVSDNANCGGNNVRFNGVYHLQ